MCITARKRSTARDILIKLGGDKKGVMADDHTV